MRCNLDTGWRREGGKLICPSRQETSRIGSKSCQKRGLHKSRSAGLERVTMERMLEAVRSGTVSKRC